MKEKPSWILYMATFPPRECGIATFTKDLVTAIDKKFAPSIKSKIVAMNNDVTNIYNYPEDVIFEINNSDIQEYIDTAKKINEIEQIKLVNIQHEFGIFGGEYGSYLIAFLEILTKKVVVTFHSVLPNPNEKLRKVVEAISQKCSSIIVMTKTAVDILRNDYKLTGSIEVIPHGIPTMPFVSNTEEKTALGYKNKIILSSFGMMNPGKGYQYVIEALPEVISKFPNLLYIIVGETHPVVRIKEGEQYRNYLESKVKELGIQKHVKFYNKYVKLSEIIKYLQASDVFVCSNTEPNQITSGTLSYAVGAGRAVISTPFLHARDFITPNIGILTEFSNPSSFRDALIKILSDSKFKEKLEKNAYAYTRHMTWPNVALSYMTLFDKYMDLIEKSDNTLPKIKLNHLIRLSDDFGIIQFANNAEADISSGYTLDDNARALIVSCMHFELSGSKATLKRIRIYLKFIKYVQQEDGKLQNIVDSNKNIDKEIWSDDAHGRALWSLGFLLGSKSIPKKLKIEAEEIFKEAIKHANKISSPRAAAFAIIGLFFHNKYMPSSDSIEKMKKLGDHLLSIYRDNLSDEWKWFESYLTYSNSKLPESLFYAHLATGEKKYLDVALSSLDFLISITFETNFFAPVGQKGWYYKNGHKAHFDQQPVDAASMVQTLFLAYKLTRNKKYLNHAMIAFRWFLGKNSLNQIVYNETTGGCHDGIGIGAVNLNQGAESTISYLIARLTFDVPLDVINSESLDIHPADSHMKNSPAQKDA